MPSSRRSLWSLVLALSVLSEAVAAPSGFPESGNGLWYESPGTIWSRHFLPVGNGFLAATTPGGSVQETTQLNIESLWSGGPFSDSNYNGGNKQPDEQTSMAEDMAAYRQAVFEAENGSITNVDKLSTAITDYGSYAGAGFLSSTLLGVSNLDVTDFGRFLDMDVGKTVTSWLTDESTFVRETFCSYESEFCIQNTTTSLPANFSQVYAFIGEPGLPAPNVTCVGNNTLMLRGFVADPGMAYELLATVVVNSGGTLSCNSATNTNGSSDNATVTVSNATSAYIAWVGGTNYDINAGDAAHNFSFTGADPHEALASTLSSVVSRLYDDLLAAHTATFRDTLYSTFSLFIGQLPDLSTPTDQLKAAYVYNVGNSYLEWVLFNYGRYLLASSARGALPANLQGKWAIFASNPWSADYHANINLQMFYWAAEVSGLNVTTSLFDYMTKTWVPRGEYTAQILYNISDGWVTHDEMNIFGYTGMKAGEDSAQWADYPESNAWMMIHAWDHFDFTNDIYWWKSQGYPLLKTVAQFHLHKLIPDGHFNDGTLVVAPCNSPEQPAVTLACAHAQQLIWQLFNAVEKGSVAANETDHTFLATISEAKSKMDKGIHIGSWGQLQEWKVDMDAQNDTHRHLSHLVGLYPGYAITSFNPLLQSPPSSFFSSSEVLQAAQTSLIHRGNGTGPDADSGWEKIWRAACWAQLGNTNEFYFELSYAIQRNFADNLFSVYDPADADPIFQIDANLGYPAAVMNALVQAPDVPSLSTPLTITLLPALPVSWPSGSVKGAKVRGGISIDFEWSDGKPSQATILTVDGFPQRQVNVVYNKKVVQQLSTGSAQTWTVLGF